MSWKRREPFTEERGDEGWGEERCPGIPLVSACRQCLAGQSILDAQGKSESAFFPLHSAVVGCWTALSEKVLSRTEDHVLRDHHGPLCNHRVLAHPPARNLTISYINLNRDCKLEVCTPSSASNFFIQHKNTSLFKP